MNIIHIIIAEAIKIVYDIIKTMYLNRKK